MTQPRSSTPSALDAVLRDLGTESSQACVRPPEELGAVGPTACLVVGARGDPATQAERLRAEGARVLARGGWAVLWLTGETSDEVLAAWRNALWPWLHVSAVYRAGARGVERETLSGRQAVAANATEPCTLLAGRRRDDVLSPEATVAKFDVNAAGWNVERGEPGYAHYRWMRRYVALFGEPSPGESVLDFGCGAGWVGIEAALCTAGAPLAFFDPSPEMVRNAERNARASGLTRLEGRVGFGERPPFDERFDHVISSGVVSFSPDHAAWFDGLVRCVKPGGTAVVGDLNPSSRGMQLRRRTRSLLPVRELNALTADVARAEFERRGLCHELTAGYQCTRPVPQLAHWSDTRLRGAFSPLLLMYNRLRAGPTRSLSAFDSWVMRLRAPP